MWFALAVQVILFIHFAFTLLVRVNIEFDARLLVAVNTQRTLLRRLSVFDTDDL